MNKRAKISKALRKAVWGLAFGPAILVTECPSCLKNSLKLEQYTGWEAAHITPHSGGGTIELYNLFPLCKVCNGQMGTQDMFCHFFEMRNMHALHALIEYVKRVIKAHFPGGYEKTRGMIWYMAQQYFTMSTEHPVFQYFMEHDIKVLQRETLELKRAFEEKRDFTREICVLYQNIYLLK